MKIVNTTEPTMELAVELGFKNENPLDDDAELVLWDVKDYLAQRLVNISGEWIVVRDVHYYGDGTMIDLEDGTEWYFFESQAEAGEAARKRWEDMAQDDPSEFTAMVGEKTLIAWGLGQIAGPGSTHVRSLQDWLDLWLDTPEEEFASYDGNEVEPVAANDIFAEELGFSDFEYVVCYRRN